jgi:hypothetical protein
MFPVAWLACCARARTLAFQPADDADILSLCEQQGVYRLGKGLPSYQRNNRRIDVKITDKVKCCVAASILRRNRTTLVQSGS